MPSASMRRDERRGQREQQLGNGLGDRVAVEAVGGVEVGEVAGLAEPLDAERRDALAEDAAEPRQRGGRGVGRW